MDNLRKLSKFFMIAAILTLVIAFLILIEDAGGEIQLFRSDEALSVGMYILLMVPLIFASIAVSLRFIAKALDERADL